MRELTNIEVYHIEITEEGSFAYISFQTPNDKADPTNGFQHIRVPLKLRPIQLSVRGNTLIDQSEKTTSIESNGK